MVNHPEIGKLRPLVAAQIGGGGSPFSPSLQRRARDVFPNAGAVDGPRLRPHRVHRARDRLLGAGAHRPSRCRAGGRCRRCSSRSATSRPARALPEGDEGEVCIRSPGGDARLLAQPEATAAAIGPGRWLRTGDIGHLDDGRLYLSSRRRDLILRGGENVYPVEVEKAIEDHPDVAEVAVFGVDDPEFGQAVKAVVVPRPARTLDVDELRGVHRGGDLVLQGADAVGDPHRAAAAQRVGQAHQGAAAHRRAPSNFVEE